MGRDGKMSARGVEKGVVYGGEDGSKGREVFTFATFARSSPPAHNV
jgi:hypothetical protein